MTEGHGVEIEDVRVDAALEWREEGREEEEDDEE